MKCFWNMLKKVEMQSWGRCMVLGPVDYWDHGVIVKDNQCHLIRTVPGKSSGNHEIKSPGALYWELNLVFFNTNQSPLLCVSPDWRICETNNFMNTKLPKTLDYFFNEAYILPCELSSFCQLFLRTGELKINIRRRRFTIFQPKTRFYIAPLF